MNINTNCRYNEIYTILREGIYTPQVITESYCTAKWAAVETDVGMGMCMYVPRVDCLEYAAINAFYNRGREHYLPPERYFTEGVDFNGKTVGVVGHMSGVENRHGRDIKKLYYFEMEPKYPEDLPVELEEELLPQCDIAVITGSALVNGTLPHLLELCESAYTILTGPSVPQCDALLDFGIDRLAGLCVADVPGMRAYIRDGVKGNPLKYADPFIISK